MAAFDECEQGRMQMQLTDLLTMKGAPVDRGRLKLLRLARAKSLQVKISACRQP